MDIKKEEPQIVKLSLRLPAEDKQEILEYGITHDLTMSQVIRRAIKQFLNNDDNY